MEGLDSNLMLYGHLRWRRHEFEFNSTSNLVPVWRESGFELNLISHGVGRS